jgi:hypothetical protein
MRDTFRIRVLVMALASAVGLSAETEDFVRRSIPVNSSGRMVLTADWGAIKVQSGAVRTAEVEVYFRGNPPSRAQFDRMLRDFSLDVSQVGSDIRVSGRFKDGWKPSPLWGPFWGWFNQVPCRDWKCLEYTWLRHMEYRVSVPREFSVDLSTTSGSITVGDLKGGVDARTSGGELRFGRIDGPVRGNTSGGSISLEGGRGRAVLRTSGGGISIASALTLPGAASLFAKAAGLWMLRPPAEASPPVCRRNPTSPAEYPRRAAASGLSLTEACAWMSRPARAAARL